MILISRLAPAMKPSALKRSSIAAERASAEPGGEQALDVAAAARRREATLNLLAVDDDQGRHLVDPESCGELGLFLDLDAVQAKGVVVTAALEHLREIALDPARLPRAAGVEEHETRAQPAL